MKYNTEVKINKRKYKLLVCLGFYKDLGLNPYEIQDVEMFLRNKPENMYNAIRTALFYGNNFDTYESLDNVISEKDILSLQNSIDLLNNAIMDSLPKQTQEQAEAIAKEVSKKENGKK